MIKTQNKSTLKIITLKTILFLSAINIHSIPCCGDISDKYISTLRNPEKPSFIKRGVEMELRDFNPKLEQAANGTESMQKIAALIISKINNSLSPDLIANLTALISSATNNDPAGINTVNLNLLTKVLLNHPMFGLTQEQIKTIWKENYEELKNGFQLQIALDPNNLRQAEQFLVSNQIYETSNLEQILSSRIPSLCDPTFFILQAWNQALNQYEILTDYTITTKRLVAFKNNIQLYTDPLSLAIIRQLNKILKITPEGPAINNEILPITGEKYDLALTLNDLDTLYKRLDGQDLSTTNLGIMLVPVELETYSGDASLDLSFSISRGQSNDTKIILDRIHPGESKIDQIAYELVIGLINQNSESPQYKEYCFQLLKEHFQSEKAAFEKLIKKNSIGVLCTALSIGLNSSSLNSYDTNGESFYKKLISAAKITPEDLRLFKEQEISQTPFGNLILASIQDYHTTLPPIDTKLRTQKHTKKLDITPLLDTCNAILADPKVSNFWKGVAHWFKAKKLDHLSNICLEYMSTGVNRQFNQSTIDGFMTAIEGYNHKSSIISEKVADYWKEQNQKSSDTTTQAVVHYLGHYARLKKDMVFNYREIYKNITQSTAIPGFVFLWSRPIDRNITRWADYTWWQN